MSGRAPHLEAAGEGGSRHAARRLGELAEGGEGGRAGDAATARRGVLDGRARSLALCAAALCAAALCAAALCAAALRNAGGPSGIEAAHHQHRVRFWAGLQEGMRAQVEGHRRATQRRRNGLQEHAVLSAQQHAGHGARQRRSERRVEECLRQGEGCRRRRQSHSALPRQHACRGVLPHAVGGGAAAGALVGGSWRPWQRRRSPRQLAGVRLRLIACKQLVPLAGLHELPVALDGLMQVPRASLRQHVRRRPELRRRRRAATRGRVVRERSRSQLRRQREGVWPRVERAQAHGPLRARTQARP